MQWQAPAAELAEKPGTMNSRTTGQMDKSVPRIVEQIVEVPLTVPQELVLQRAAVENIAQVSPRGKAMCARISATGLRPRRGSPSLRAA